MNLQQLQYNLTCLIKDRKEADETDPYVRSVKASSRLALIQTIAVWWRKQQIENYCRLTANLLQLKNSFEPEVQAFFCASNYSAFREEVGIQFLEHVMRYSPDPLAVLMAEFESSLLKMRAGLPVMYCRDWPYEPYALIGGLINHTLATTALPGRCYRVRISEETKEKLFEVECLNE